MLTMEGASQISRAISTWQGFGTTLVRTEMRAAAPIAKTQRKPLHAIGSAKMASATSQREK
jgi:hypothetical protein